MGIYLNPGNEGFAEAIRSQTYVDKTGLIAHTNKVIGTEQRYLCVSRPRRFGKTMAGKMLAAYYGRDCDSAQLFSGLEITQQDSFVKYLNKHNVIFLNMQDFLSRSTDSEEMTARIDQKVSRELQESYTSAGVDQEKLLADVLDRIYATEKEKFIFIIDEWDCVFREREEYKTTKEILRLFKDSVKR